jgi:F-type H+-transporting ATPase subunit epsilon
LFTGEVKSVVVPGSEGQFTVLKDHAPVMTTLKSGLVTVSDVAGKIERLYVRGGFADVSSLGFTILAEQATPLAEIDISKLEAKSTPQDDLSDARTDEARHSAQEKVPICRRLRSAIS